MGSWVLSGRKRVEDVTGAPRPAADLAARRAIFAPEMAVPAPADGAEFWGWYARFVRCGRPVEVAPVDVEPYPSLSRGPALWFSGGVESTYTLATLDEQGVSPALLHIEDHPVFDGPDRRIGQIHFLCAVVAATLGYSPIYMGMERHDLLLGHQSFMRGYVDRHPVFADMWSGYQPDHPLVTVCGDLHKEEIIAWLHARGIRVTGTCDVRKDGTWCGDCYKCFEAFYSAKAVGVDLGIALRRSGFDRYHAEYRRYVDSGFVDNFNNSYQHYVRLQISYGLVFDPDSDCAGGGG